ncbi:hypothetical protein KP509_18G057300 [Ceratopteris richardii]|uniref:RING-type E3 ubiquitin transferase n=1 Tax=Ceratopteris richardii TaxID=49495 RepID=A0A8T2STL1_CERRI|nr:hypothetical protein KP509_18G057300 [Ceratopteris richardii]
MAFHFRINIHIMRLRIPYAAFFLMLLLARQPLASASASVQRSDTDGFLHISSFYRNQENNSKVIGLSVRRVADITPPGDADGVNQTASDSGIPPSISRSEQRHPFHDESGYTRTSSILLIIIFVIAFFTMGCLSVYIQKHCIGSISPQSRINHGIPAWQSPQEQQHGISSHSVSTLPTVLYSKDQALKEAIGMKAISFSSECAVCLTPFDDGEELRLLPVCGHSYHKECIDMWFFSHETCPLCRRIIGHKQKADGDPDNHRPPSFQTHNLSDMV